jgi:phosphatidylinositol kinase/protein kinase (PI-3  family)
MYAWTISTREAQRRQLDSQDQDSNDDNSNEVERDSMASRALIKIQAKLKGQADDSLGYSSVEGQVECLIQKATSKSLLSRLFRGWQAYL